MPETTFALLYEGRTDSYRGCTRWWSHDNPEAWRNLAHVLAKIDIDAATAHALELARPIWSKNHTLPLAYLDNEGHGENRGLVVCGGSCQYFEADKNLALHFTPSELKVRISIGHRIKGNLLHDLAHPNRHHFSIEASRQFFPSHWKEQGLNEFASMIEHVNYSFRWLDGKFDDWSNPDKWRPYDDNLSALCFHEQRTTHMVATLDRPHEHSAAFLEKFGRKEALLSPSPKVELFERPYEYANQFLRRAFSRGSFERIPIVGYGGVTSALRAVNFPYIQDDRQVDTPEAGATFLFEQVLPALQRFIAL